jgi:hypothetical protein
MYKGLYTVCTDTLTSCTMKQTLMGSLVRVQVQEGGQVGGGSELKTGLTLNDDIYLSVSDGTADVVDVVYVNMYGGNSNTNRTEFISLCCFICQPE